jgi:hypothetical protein
MHPIQAVVRKHSGERPNALTGSLARLRYKHRAACAAPLLSNHPTQAVMRKHFGERPNAHTGPLARLRFYWANRSSPCPAIG